MTGGKVSNDQAAAAFTAGTLAVVERHHETARPSLTDNGTDDAELLSAAALALALVRHRTTDASANSLHDKLLCEMTATAAELEQRGLPRGKYHPN